MYFHNMFLLHLLSGLRLSTQRRYKMLKMTRTYCAAAKDFTQDQNMLQADHFHCPVQRQLFISAVLPQQNLENNKCRERTCKERQYNDMKKQIQPTLGNKRLGLFLFHAVFQHIGTVVTAYLKQIYQLNYFFFLISLCVIVHEYCHRTLRNFLIQDPRGH